MGHAIILMMQWTLPSIINEPPITIAAYWIFGGGWGKSGTNSIKHNCTYKHNGQEWEVEYTDQKEKKHSNLALVKLSNSTIHLPVKSTSFGLHEL